MGDHRISLKAKFEMHGHVAELDQWRNYYDGYPDEIHDWLIKQIEIGMQKFYDADFEYQEEKRRAAEAEKEATERAELERLKAKYEPAPND